MTCSTSEKVVLGTTAINDPQFKEDGIAIDFSAVTRVVFTFGESGVIADSDVTAGIIDWAIGDGVIRTEFGGLTIPEGRYLVDVVAYDPAHPNGQVLAHDSGPQLIYQFVNA